MVRDRQPAEFAAKAQGFLLIAATEAELLASYDQGIFQQVLWNSLHGHWFESTLSSQLSTNVEHAGELPSVDYERLTSTHTSPLFSIARVARGRPCREGLIDCCGSCAASPRQWLVAGTHPTGCLRLGSNALIGPTLGNFTDLCQLTAVFALVLGLVERRTSADPAGRRLMPLIKNTGVLLVAVGFWLLVTPSPTLAFGFGNDRSGEGDGCCCAPTF